MGANEGRGRLAGKTAVIVGAGQTPGETLGNGRAMALLFAQEGARVLCVDRILARAEETAAMIAEAGGEASAMKADVTRAVEVAEIVTQAQGRLGRIDIVEHSLESGHAQRIPGIERGNELPPRLERSEPAARIPVRRIDQRAVVEGRRAPSVIVNPVELSARRQSHRVVGEVGGRIVNAPPGWATHPKCSPVVE